ARISPRGWFGRAWRPVKLAAIGMLKARVLPDPVRPRPSTSRPFSVPFRVAAWMGNAVSRPCFDRARTSVDGTRRSAKEAAVSGCGAGLCGAVLRVLEFRGAGFRGVEPRWSDGRAGAVLMKNLHGSVGTAEAVVHSAARLHPCPRWRARSIAPRTTVSRTPAQKTKNVSGVIAAGAATAPRRPGWLPSVP